MLRDPSKKYRPFPVIDLPNRQWPSRQITTAPIWCSTDLRDGNQALFEPMNVETKKRLFKVLCDVGLQGDRGRLHLRLRDGFPDGASAHRREARFPLT